MLPGVRFNATTPRQTISDAEISNARQLVRKQCEKCHDQDSLTDQAIADARSGRSTPLIPPRWLQRGLYDHAAHRKVDCKFCHAAAYTGPPSSKPMIGGIETCVDCHRSSDVSMPERLSDLPAGQPRWASDNCILCHRYHSWEPK